MSSKVLDSWTAGRSQRQPQLPAGGRPADTAAEATCASRALHTWRAAQVHRLAQSLHQRNLRMQASMGVAWSANWRYALQLATAAHGSAHTLRAQEQSAQGSRLKTLQFQLSASSLLVAREGPIVCAKQAD